MPNLRSYPRAVSCPSTTRTRSPALQAGYWLGVPRILVYLFGVWGLLLALSAWARGGD